MGWLTKIFKGSRHRISVRQHHGQYIDDTVWEQQTSPSKEEEEEDAWSENNNEDIDHAIALSLLEEDRTSSDDEDYPNAHSSDHRKGKKVIDSKSQQEEEDEQLAKALEESLRVKSPPRNDYGSNFSPYPNYNPYGYKICAGCNAEIGQGRYFNFVGLDWHPECFKCHACGVPITDSEFSMYDHRPYHRTCYKEQHRPRCEVCKNFIPTNAAGVIEYRAHRFWRQKYCPSHEHDGTPHCCSCERAEPIDAKYMILDDGRKLCLECLESAIMDTNECQPLYLEIQEFFEGLNMKVKQQVPFLLVERQALNEAIEEENHGHYYLPVTRGVCLSEERTIKAISRRPKIRGFRITNMFTEPYKLIRKCDVTAILVLYGLPRLLTGSILAHEMMHAYMRLQGCPIFRPEVEEGICQVLAHMWLDAEIMSGSGSNGASSSTFSSSSSSSSKKGKRSQFERNLGNFFKYSIECDTSKAYGDGFREGNSAVLKYGLRGTLDHMHLTGSFP